MANWLWVVWKLLLSTCLITQATDIQYKKIKNMVNPNNSMVNCISNAGRNWPKTHGVDLRPTKALAGARMKGTHSSINKKSNLVSTGKCTSFKHHF